MGEGRMRRLVAASMVMLLVLLIPVSAEETGAVRLEIEVLDENSKPWYGAGESVLLGSSIVNDGAATSITEDPSCGVVMRIANTAGTTLLDESTTCRGQSRGLDVPSGTSALESLQWDLTDQSGNLVPAGMYTILVELAGSGLSSTIDVMVQQQSNLPLELEFSTSMTHRTDTLENGQPFVLTYEVYNPTSHPIDVSSFDECRLLIEFESSILGPSCNAGVDVIEPYGVIPLGHSLFQPNIVGDVPLTVATPDGHLLSQKELHIHQSEMLENPLQLSISTPYDVYPQGSLLEGSLSLHNTGDQNEFLRFTSTCRGSFWVVDESGAIVFDSLEQTSCRDTELDVVVGANSQTTFPLPSWSFVDETGCSLTTGDYVIVGELPEFSYATSTTVKHIRDVFSRCGDMSAPQTSLLLDATESDLEFELQLTGNDEFVDIEWHGRCKAFLHLWDMETEQKVYETKALCDDEIQEGYTIRIDSDDTLVFRGSELKDVTLTDGNYRLRLDLITEQEILTEQTFSWPILNEIVDGEDGNQGEIPVTQTPSVFIAGVWSGVLTADGTCWMLEDEDGTIHMLAESAMANWLPERGANGMYEAQQTVANDACSRFTAESYTLTSILLETPPVEEETVVEETNVVEIEEIESQAVPDWAPQAVTVLTVSAILSMLGFAVFNNEAIRISTTLTGLWFLGLIGKTSETSDGRFQRGRLLGYLTANPGCHFRALLSALDMSNGQLSHHLRVLEQEESIWRRKDGRLVRYYPLTNTLHPLLEADALPVPILAPDPLSLQGKILVLLDHDSQMGDFPTQAELAKRLDKSQQLISHHLRTLEKYGLIEGRRMGMRNRYKLTKEAMFLLETSEAYLQNDMNL